MTGPTVAARDVDTHHLFTPPTSRGDWERRATELREQVLFSAGLWPMPTRTPLRPRVTGRTEAPDFIVENVAIETLPGFYLGGNLYRPRGKGPFPAIANPHGHWSHGRLEREQDVPRAEPPPAPMGEGRADLVAIGVNLARRGFVVFAYDMVGYNDTSQVGHGFAGSLEPWLWNTSLMGLQLWNSMRAVDYLASLPYVDRRRIGATGASGGGTQTFLLTAVDERVRASVPVNMVSAYMQGGCLCENGPGLRIGTDNVEIAALAAPRPLLLVAATGDWTRHVPEEEWPAVRDVYALYGAADRTEARQFNYGHNYNAESRAAMYAWFERWLGDGKPREEPERPFTLHAGAMRLWRSDSQRPAGALDEGGLIASLRERSEAQWAALRPRDARGLARFARAARPALRHALALPPLQPRALRGGTARPSVLIVADTEQISLARELAGRLQGSHRVAVEPIDVEAMTPDALWGKFYTCYNRTPLSLAVERVMTAMRRERDATGTVPDVVGLGSAGPAALLARALVPARARVAIDLGDLAQAPGGDAAYLGRFCAPGLRRAGDVRNAAILVAPGPLLVFASRGLLPPTTAEACRAAGGALREELGAPDADTLADWLARPEVGR
ncbi:MAG: acetylxylan esterase [Chthonomonadales bacterium]|nr:acetylxylan esterase [Chthonomonadales bacterium]